MTFEALAESFAQNEHIYLPGSCGEPTELVEAFVKNPESTRALEFTTTYIPGINSFPIEEIHSSAKVNGLFMTPALKAAQAEGKFRHLPVSYSGFVRYVKEVFQPDTVVVTVSPPNGNNQVSLGVAAEFSALALGKAKRKIAIINENMPFVEKAPRFLIGDFDQIVPSASPLKTYIVGAPSPEAKIIAEHISNFIEDGSALQVGLGKVPDALLNLLHDRKRLRLHSGMFSDGLIALSNAGALGAEWPHMSCVLVGSKTLYDWAAQQSILAIQGCDQTHDAAYLATIDRLVAVNSALEVDIFGQCNLETANGHAVSSVGGAPDFARAARVTSGGLSIIALPATFFKGTKSRITARIATPGIVSIPRYDVDLVVTEYGIADLRYASVHERALSIISIAAPQFQSDLTDAWNEIRDHL